LLLLITINGYNQNPRFVNPIEGVYGADFIIVNYVDWSYQGILDYACRSKTYNGHQGTDYVLKSFPQMDSGVSVLAVDTGLVIAILDTEFDRETVSDTSKGLGNFVALKHSGDLFTYYAHLKQNSVLVNVGDTVLPGEKIAEVASSGNSTDPHLHFELWYDSLYLIDPYAGTCGNASSYWLNPFPYDNSYAVWESGLINTVPTLNELRERPEEKLTYYLGIDSVISFWTLQYGLSDGDQSSIEWFSPDNDLWFSWNLTYNQDWWYHYFWSYINMPPANLAGNWKAVYSVNGQQQKEIDFVVSTLTNNPEENLILNANEIRVLPDPTNNTYTVLGDLSLYQIDILNSFGAVVQTVSTNLNIYTVDLSAFQGGLFFIRAQNLNNNQISVQKIISF